ncbi:hypothetical protein KGMB02408_10350 [Bacteroides faecalis]|uniref:Uncharacterized protein n=1 Tax=Bacteroides faecalis TaxID=2447885 RepID=A0A401LRA2_9BACE|nr:hypothetical protein KGMB02408_10350 [Bacteroides faecalis]
MIFENGIPKAVSTEAECASLDKRSITSKKLDTKNVLTDKKLNKLNPNRFAKKTRFGKMPLYPECK